MYLIFLSKGTKLLKIKSAFIHFVNIIALDLSLSLWHKYEVFIETVAQENSDKNSKELL